MSGMKTTSAFTVIGMETLKMLYQPNLQIWPNGKIPKEDLGAGPIRIFTHYLAYLTPVSASRVNTLEKQVELEGREDLRDILEYWRTVNDLVEFLNSMLVLGEY